MWEWLRSRRAAARLDSVFESAPAQTPEGMRLYAVGDIHGRADLLEQLLEQIATDVVRHPEKRSGLIFLGDYIDRGPESFEVLERLCRDAALPGDERRFMIGNHEQMLLSFLQDPLRYRKWFEFGGLATLASYRISHPGPDPEALVDAAAALRAMLPEHQAKFLERLEYSCRLGGYLFVHAGIRPGLAIEAQHPQDLIWIREAFLQYRKPHPLMVIHGHHALERVDVRTNRIGIDTSAFATGRLTCLILDGSERLLLDTVEGGPLPLGAARS